MSHLEERMETDLNAIRDWLWKLGDDVEEALRGAKKVLAPRDTTMAYDIILGDHPMQFRLASMILANTGSGSSPLNIYNRFSA